MKSKFKKRHLLLFSALIVLWSAFYYSQSYSVTTKTQYYDTQVAAAEKMKLSIELIKKYKLENNIQINDKDYNKTGIIGDDFNGITTTLGYLPAKRTTANPDMAAYIVRLFKEAGLEKGSKVAISASGSFPALNIAVVSACEQLELIPVMIVSVGASTYGANNPEFTAPEMMLYLAEKGILPNSVKGVTFGGDYDIGYNMDKKLLKDIEERINNYNIDIYKDSDFEKNITWRRNIFEEGGMPDAFVSIGGNLTSTGDESINQVGLLDYGNKTFNINSKSGLTEIYYNKEIPVIRLIEIEKLATQAGIPFDPQPIEEIGISPVYYEAQYPKAIIIASILTSFILIIIFKRKETESE